MRLPPLHTQLGPHDHFYSLAIVVGSYQHTSGSESAHFVLSWSPSPDFTAFSLSTVAADGRELSYHRGTDGLDTVEFTLLKAAVSDGVPAHCWRLFPRSAVPEGGLAGIGHREGYFAARRRLALALYHIRTRVSLGAGSTDLLLFQPADPRGPGAPEGAAPNFEELLLAAVERARERHRD